MPLPAVARVSLKVLTVTLNLSSGAVLFPAGPMDLWIWKQSLICGSSYDEQPTPSLDGHHTDAAVCGFALLEVLSCIHRLLWLTYSRLNNQ
jgi:hypothetical protein